MKNKSIVLFALTASLLLSSMPLSSANAMLGGYLESEDGELSDYIKALTDNGCTKWETIHPFNTVAPEYDDSKIEVYGFSVEKNPPSAYQGASYDRWEVAFTVLHTVNRRIDVVLNSENKDKCLEFVEKNYTDLPFDYDDHDKYILTFEEQSENQNFIEEVAELIIDLTDLGYCDFYAMYGNVECYTGNYAMLNQYSIPSTETELNEMKSFVNSEDIEGTWVDLDSDWWSGYIQYDDDVTGEEVLHDTDMICQKFGVTCLISSTEDSCTNIDTTYDIDSYISILRAESSEDKTVNPVTTNTTESTDSATTITTKAIKGDINNDNQVNSIDAVFVLKDFASQILGNKSTLDLSVADMNDDGKINSSDAVIILKQYAQSLISK
jgi:hypothetical protein